jgi:KDO2-lipid IV(A) lauroyltransferase
LNALNDWFARLWIRIIKSMAHTPIERRAFYARIIASVLWYAIPKRRKVTLTNLRLCFPEKTEAERVEIAKSTYRHLARAALDHGVLWAGTAEEVDAMVRFDGIKEMLDTEERNIIVVVPHFAGLDAAGIGIGLHVRCCTLYQKQSNQAWDDAARAGRSRFSEPVLIAKSDRNDLRQVIRAMRQGLPFFYLPDMDHGARNSVFVPFFGVQAATLPMVSRLARLTKSKVVFMVSEMTDDGYVVHVSDFWKDFPTDDYVADTRRVTAELEKWILRLPDQYMWLHRRFKTRPEGEPSVYD